MTTVARAVADQWVLRPGSAAWQYFGSVRNVLLGPQILVLQVAHPVVGAGVLQHSHYQQEPWRRLVRTARSLTVIAYGDAPSAVAEAERLRAMHRTIKGVDAQGRRYHALNPQAYAWVHATLVRGVIDAQRIFGDGIPADLLPGFYEDMLGVGRLLGLREQDLPSDLAAFDAHYDTVVRDVLEYNDAVRDVLVSIREPARPGTRFVPALLWRPVARFVGDRAYLVTVGTLPVVLRDRLGLTWSPQQERRLRRFARNVRRGMSLLMPPLFAAIRLVALLRSARSRLARFRLPGYPSAASQADG
jgi:uncharacterized protein (DUF2236 family)